MYQDPKYALCNLRTEWWTDDLVRELDDRNLDRLRCMPPEWQRHVIMTYRPSEQGELRDLQKHVSGTIGGVRRLLFANMSTEEMTRLQDLASTGTRISYKPCIMYESRGSCKYGNCTHPHV